MPKTAIEEVEEMIADCTDRVDTHRKVEKSLRAGVIKAIAQGQDSSEEWADRHKAWAESAERDRDRLTDLFDLLRTRQS